MTDRVRWIAVTLLGLALAGCASGPKPLPRCDGPWAACAGSAVLARTVAVVGQTALPRAAGPHRNDLFGPSFGEGEVPRGGRK